MGGLRNQKLNVNHLNYHQALTPQECSGMHTECGKPLNKCKEVIIVPRMVSCREEGSCAWDTGETYALFPLLATSHAEKHSSLNKEGEDQCQGNSWCGRGL